MERLLRFREVRRVDEPLESADEAESGVIYVVGGTARIVNSGHAIPPFGRDNALAQRAGALPCYGIKWAQWLCPCGCGRLVSIPYHTGYEHMPRCWRMRLYDGRVTFEPSVLSAWPCKSHYYVDDNKVLWC